MSTFTWVSRSLSAVAIATVAAEVRAQGFEDLLTQGPLSRGGGWEGFLDVSFLISTLMNLVLAAVLGAIVAYHPKHVATADTLEELEAPKVYVLYAVIGAIIGILVVEYDYIVGLVIFGIGGLIRFRTQLTSANLTGRVIFVTLIGLTTGLNLPHVAVLATGFAYALIYIIEARVTYRIDVRSLDPAIVAESASAYRELLERLGCRVISERKNPLKQHVTMLVSSPQGMRRDELESLVDEGIAAPLKGAVDWRTD